MTAAVWQASRHPAGVEEHVQMNVGVLQKLGSPCHFHGRNPGRSYRVTNSRLVALQAVATRDTKQTECNRGIAEQRERSEAKRMTGSRSVLIVPLKAGNSFSMRTRWREARCHIKQPMLGTTSSAQ